MGHAPRFLFSSFILEQGWGKGKKLSRQVVYIRKLFLLPQNSCPESLLSHEGLPSILIYASLDDWLLVGYAQFGAMQNNPFSVRRKHNKER